MSLNRSLGVWVVNKEFGRGFDLKLAKDAQVLVFGKERFGHTEMIQMIGRGCRSQDSSRGQIILFGGDIVDENCCFETLCENHEKHDGDDGKLFINCFKAILNPKKMTRSLREIR